MIIRTIIYIVIYFNNNFRPKTWWNNPFSWLIDFAILSIKERVCLFLIDYTSLNPEGESNVNGREIPKRRFVTQFSRNLHFRFVLGTSRLWSYDPLCKPSDCFANYRLCRHVNLLWRQRVTRAFLIWVPWGICSLVSCAIPRGFKLPRYSNRDKNHS